MRAPPRVRNKINANDASTRVRQPNQKDEERQTRSPKLALRALTGRMGAFD
jgi:hypothetical protein